MSVRKFRTLSMRLTVLIALVAQLALPAIAPRAYASHIDVVQQDGVNSVDTFANIGDRVWYDTDGQGDQDGGEVGINGVTVKLYSGACGPSGSPIQTKVTSGDGAYLFTSVSYNNSYCVAVDTTTLPSGYTITTNNNPKTVALTSAGNLTVDFGYETTVCPNNLLLNPSFETASGSNSIGDKKPANWIESVAGETGVTTGFSPPDGIYVGYVWTNPSGSPATMHQVVSATPGYAYQMTFYSGTHTPSVQPTIAIRFYNSSNVEVGTPAIHIITKDIDGSTLGGPYTLSATAPSGATSLRVIFTDPSSSGSGAGAKGDALCLQNTALDFGDLPDTGSGTGSGNYQTQLSDNGPRHTLVSGIRLGAAIDAESNGQQNATATGDDSAGATPDDEDGVTIPALTAGASATIVVNSSAAGKVNAFIDWNNDGDFADANEALTQLTVAAGNNNLVVAVPANAVTGTSIGARFRLSSAGGLSSTGAAADGEVEDYLVTIAQLLDYGDAPDTGAGTAQGNYNTLATDNGPRHAIVANLRLGVNAPDADPGTLQNAAATADDTSNTGSADDEDGVSTLPSVSTISTSVPLAVSVFNNTGATVNLACWIDFNRDGDFVDTGERAATTVSASAAQQNANLTFTGFAAPTAGTSYLRCRLASAAGEVTNPTGAANSGEVEDYQITINSANADLQIVKTDSPDPVGLGQNLSYTLLITNNGPGTATGVVVTDTLPVGVTYVSATPSQGTCSQSLGVVTCNLNSLANGASATVTIVTTVSSSYPAFSLGNLTDYLFFFANGSEDANWQGATKGFVGDVAVDGLQADERTSGSVPYGGTIYTNDSTLSAWAGIVDQNDPAQVSPAQAFASTGQTSRITGLESDLANAFTQINVLAVTSGYASVASTSLNGLNTQNGRADTYVINVTSGFQVSSQINITGDAGDVFILRWDEDANFSDGYEGTVKFQSGGAIVPLGGLTPANFVHVAGVLNSSGGGSTPASPYPQGPRYNNGLGSLIVNGSDFSGGGFFTGYWLTTGDPADGNNGSLSNGIFVGGWYTLNDNFSMTSGTSGVYVEPSPCLPGEIYNLASVSANGTDPNQTNDDDFTCTYVTPVPTYTLSKVLNSISPIRNGETISFTIRITNTGTVTLTTVPLTDTYDTAYMTYVGSTPNSEDQINDGTLNWGDLTQSGAKGFNADLAPGQSFSVIVNFVGRADTTGLPAQAPCTVFGHTCNVATVSAAKYDPDGPGGVGEQGPLPPKSAWDDVQIIVPTAIALSDRVVSYTGGAVELSWRTANESDLIGFHIYRSENGGEAVRLTDALLSAQKPGQSDGAIYAYTDARSVETGKRYRYVLEFIGASAPLGQEAIGEVQTGARIFLPTIGR